MITSLVMLVLWVIILAVILGLLIYIVDSAPFIEPPFKGTIRWLIIVVGIIIVILLLLNFMGVLDGGGPPVLS